MIDKFKIVSDIQFDGTFTAVLILHYQLNRVFIDVNCHSLPGLDIPMNGKTKKLFRAVLITIRGSINFYHGGF